jgi:hypothetical protein
MVLFVLLQVWKILVSRLLYYLQERRVKNAAIEGEMQMEVVGQM